MAHETFDQHERQGAHTVHGQSASAAENTATHAHETAATAPTGSRLARENAPVDDPSLDKAQPKKRELPSRKNTSVRNLTWAIGLNLAIVAIVAAVIVGFGRTDRNTVTDASQQINLAESAKRASDQLGFTAVSAQPDGWVPRTATLSLSEPASWNVTYTSPSGKFTQLIQSKQELPAITGKITGTVKQGDTIDIDGATCRQFTVEKKTSNDTPETYEGLDCPGSQSHLVIYSAESAAELKPLMQSALHSERENR